MAALTLSKQRPVSLFKNVPTEDATPRADSLIETFRAIGYSPETAVADIIDNSIAAGAKRIGIRFNWAGTESTVVISDDGAGMTAEQLLKAMTPGFLNPLQERGAHDLGRFGLGLKTASFSQCRRLTVYSKPTGGTVSYRCWDLNHIADTQEWKLLIWHNALDLKQQLALMPRGTTVLWELPDRICHGLRADSEDHRKQFLRLVERVQWHLEMVFHRFLRGGMEMTINGHRLQPWDPFLIGRAGQQARPAEEISPGVVVTPHILPHHRNLSDQEHDSAGRVKGWNAHQGFYVYRGDRLLIAGDWLGLFTSDEHHKLARIAIDIPTSLDQQWQIDIRKASARAPHSLRSRLKSLATKIRGQAADVYRDRGQKLQKLSGKPVTPVWVPKVTQERTRYVLNRDHEVLQQMMEQVPAGTPAGTLLRDALRCIEEAIPVPLIFQNAAERPLADAHPFEEEDTEALAMMRRIYARRRAMGATPDSARQYVGAIDPFQHKPHLLDLLTD